MKETYKIKTQTTFSDDFIAVVCCFNPKMHARGSTGEHGGARGSTGEHGGARGSTGEHGGRGAMERRANCQSFQLSP